jgi:N,N'-diacetyllegionaminate synthase
MSIRIIAEVGSTHMGKIEYAKEAVDRCIDLGVDAIKFQLFPNSEDFTKSGNVWLSPDMYLEIVDYADNQIDVTASVFDEDSYRFLLKTKPPFIKFAYSQNRRWNWIDDTLENGIEAVVSCDIMSDRKVAPEATKLFCVPRYPVYEKLVFDELFPRFDGFSDHTLGYAQTLEAVLEGAKIIEKHMTLNHSDIVCPDSYFALRPAELAGMVASIRRIEGELL